MIKFLVPVMVILIIAVAAVVIVKTMTNNRATKRLARLADRHDLFLHFLHTESLQHIVDPWAAWVEQEISDHLRKISEEDSRAAGARSWR